MKSVFICLAFLGISGLCINAQTPTPVNAALVRGPYLQVATPNSIVIRWRTDIPTDSRVEYGLTSSSLNQAASQSPLTTEHQVQLTGLAASTLYYYSVGSSSQQFTPSGTMYFRTSPPVGTRAHFRFWAIGDAGTADQNQLAVRDAFYLYNGSPHADGWIMLGDNAYNNGYDSQYQGAVFSNMYEQTLQNTPLWPAPGNHDYNNHIPFSPPPAYYDIFTLPANGEAGGVPSSTEKYYSYDYGNVHFIVLDSYDEGRGSSDPMASWLVTDLAATSQEWIVAYWHHPPYTKGSHDSDDNFLNGELVEMRSSILPILENGGVDLVLCGHSHSYERTYLLNGHYGYSNTLNNSMIVDGSTGVYPAVCPYEKNTQVSAAHKGTVYAVIGCSGKTSSVSSGWPHPAMCSTDANDFGSLILDIEKNRLEARFLTSNHVIYDQFTLIKNAGRHQTVSFCPGDTLQLVPSWPGSRHWFPGNSAADSLTLAPVIPTVYFVSDSAGCLRDTFSIVQQVNPPCSPLTGLEFSAEPLTVQVIPSLAESGTPLMIYLGLTGKANCVVQLKDLSGRVLQQQDHALPAGQHVLMLEPGNEPAGVYFIEVIAGAVHATQKIILY